MNLINVVGIAQLLYNDNKHLLKLIADDYGGLQYQSGIAHAS